MKASVGQALILKNLEVLSMTQIEMVHIPRPEWCTGRQLDEMKFCEYFLEAYPLIYSDGSFFNRKGRVPTEKVKGMIFDYLSMYVKSGIPKMVNTLLEVMKLHCANELPINEGAFQCSNGTYILSTEEFRKEADPARHRLPVRYNPAAPEPVLWLNFLSQLLEEEDILTLQEYMGYCLLPVTIAQKMMLIIGSGGEGKSRIGILLQQLLGQNMCNGNLNKVETNPFARADLQHRLVMVDDDLRMEALNSTNYIKSIITAEQPMDLERKGEQSYQGRLYCRFLAFGNGNLRSLHDRSHGFFRRQIILTTKPKDPNRVDDPYLSKYLAEELEGILQWCIQGLRRLWMNDMQFTLSQKARENLLYAMREGNNILDFLQSQGYIRMDATGQITSRRLYLVYKDWCEDNVLPPLSSSSFVSWIIQNGAAYGISYSNHVPGGNGREVRGFVGIRAAV